MSNKDEIACLEEINEFLKSISMLNVPEAVRQWIEEQTAENCKRINTLEELEKWRIADWESKTAFYRAICLP